MKKKLPLFLVPILMVLAACAPTATTTAPTAQTSVPTTADAPTNAPAATDTPTDQKQYTNAQFKFSFKYPSNWFGPDEYISGDTLRLAVGSDVVYPYGQVPETPSDVKNSYLVVIQYTKNNQNIGDQTTLYQTLAAMKDNDSVSGTRNVTIRTRAVKLGRFDGFEYISTVSETAQTEYFYTRSILLIDKQTNDSITILAQPNNVEVSDVTKRPDVYRSIDAANVPTFYKLIDSITVE